MAKIKVLFICTGNSARSQMAEAFLRNLAGDRFEAFSAGREPKGIHPLTVKVMEERGISLDGQYSEDVQSGVELGSAHATRLAFSRVESASR